MKLGDLVKVHGTVGYDKPINIDNHAEAIRHYAGWFGGEEIGLVLDLKLLSRGRTWARVLTLDQTVWVQTVALKPVLDA